MRQEFQPIRLYQNYRQETMRAADSPTLAIVPKSPLKETWRLIDLEYRDDPFRNMAVEEAIPRSVGEGAAPNTVRFWHNSNTIVLGCFQSADLEVNFDACKASGTEIVRRFTGGGGVSHYACN